MSTYWVMLILPVLFGLIPVRGDQKLQQVVFWLTGLMLAILIGLRHEIGGDWFRYIDLSYGISKGTNFDFLSFYTGDYGYRLVHWVSINYLNGIYSTNLICAIFFVSGLIRFSKAMPIPWLALFVSIPFLVVVVSMGYTRQAAAIGFLMWGLVDLVYGKRTYFYVFIIIGSLFHLTLLIMLPIAAIYNLKKSNLVRVLSLSILIALMAIVVFASFIEQIEHMIYYYVTIKFHHSDGAIVRVFMSFCAAVVFFIYHKEFKERYNDERLWFIFSIVSIVLLPIAFSYSTLVDRIAIYFIPLQLVVFSRIPILIKSSYYRLLFVLGVIFLYMAALFVWLNFGNFSSYWLPYQNILMK